MTTVKPSGKSFAIIAHRGIRTHSDFQRIAPENTMPAFKAAEAEGFEIELDVYATRDTPKGAGRLIIHHDFDTGRTFRLSKQQLPITQCDFETLKKATLDLREHEASVNRLLGHSNAYQAPRTYETIRIPELPTVLNELPKTHFYVELKSLSFLRAYLPTFMSAWRSNNQVEEKLVRLIQEKNAYDRITVISFSPLMLRRIKKLDPKIKTGLNFTLSRAAQRIPFFLKAFVNSYAKRWTGIDSLQPSYGATTPQLVEAAHQANLPIIPWVKQETRPQEVGRFPDLIDMGVDGLITNAPDLLKAEVAKKRGF